METLLLVGVSVGIVAGAIAILDKLFQILPRKTNYKKLFEKEFEDWKASNFAYTMPKVTFLKLLGYIFNNDFDDERRAFALLTAIFYGDKSMHELISMNKNNNEAITHLFNSLAGKGIRVGWRSEYALTQMNKQAVHSYMERLPTNAEEDSHISSCIKRISEDKVLDFLKEQSEEDNQKLRGYAHEVLTQIEARSLEVSYCCSEGAAIFSQFSKGIKGLD